MAQAAFAPNPTPKSTFVDQNKLGVNLAMLDNATATWGGTTGARFALGDVIKDNVGNEYRYVEFQTAVQDKDCVILTEAYLCSQAANVGTNAAALLGREVGVAINTVPADVTTTNKYYGWIVITAASAVSVKSGTVAANAAVATTTTVGQIDDAVANPTINIVGMATVAADSGGFCTVRFPNGARLGTTN